MPKRTKHRKMHKGRMNGNSGRGTTIAFGDFAIKALEAGWINSRHIEAARIAMTRSMRRQGKVWIQTRKISPFLSWINPFRPAKSD